MNLAFGTCARVRPAEAQVVIVRGNDQGLTVECRVHAWQYADDILHRELRAALARHGEGLEIAIIATPIRRQRHEPEALETLRDVTRRRIKTPAAGATSLAFGACQPLDVGLHALDVELRLDLTERLPRRQFDPL